MNSIAENRDCMEAMAEFEDNHFDLAIVDPPYGIGAENHAGGKENRWKQWDVKNWDSSTPDTPYFLELFRVSSNQIIWGGNYMSEFLPSSMGWIIWDKGQRGFSLADGEMAWTSFNRAMRIFEYARVKCITVNKIHPTQKPVALYKWLLNNYAKQGDKILDTHLGSGSSRIACYDLGFAFYGTELDKDYFDAQEERFNNHIAQGNFLRPQETESIEQSELSFV